MPHKIKQLILQKLDQTMLEVEFLRIGAEVFSEYGFALTNRFVIQTIAEALESQADPIADMNRVNLSEGQAYVSLPHWELLEDDELLIAYDIEVNHGRRLKEIADNTLTPYICRQWYANRKNENEYLVSDFEGINFWIPE